MKIKVMYILKYILVILLVPRWQKRNEIEKLKREYQNK
jgi:hypothetical protein